MTGRRHRREASVPSVSRSADVSPGHLASGLTFISSADWISGEGSRRYFSASWASTPGAGSAGALPFAGAAPPVPIGQNRVWRSILQPGGTQPNVLFMVPEHPVAALPPEPEVVAVVLVGAVLPPVPLAPGVPLVGSFPAVTVHDGWPSWPHWVYPKPCDPPEPPPPASAAPWARRTRARAAATATAARRARRVSMCLPSRR